MRKIFLYGPPGSGKSNVGKILSKNLNARFIDIDAEIESRDRESIAKIISDQGEAAFRRLESQVIERVCDTPWTESSNSGWTVAALGGGALLSEENRARCEANGVIIFLDVDHPTLVSWLEKEEAQRPLLAGDLEKKLVNLLEQRKDHYASFPNRVANIITRNHISDQVNGREYKSSNQLAWEIQQKLGCYHVLGMGTGYDVTIESGALLSIGEFLIDAGLKGSVGIVCDKNVARLHANQALDSLTKFGFETHLFVIDPGESSKTLETIASLWQNFLASGLDRKSTIIALGGGVVGDLAGFAASTYMRGCNWVAVPTTLLSMVDASLGGKTGFDLQEGKNLIGSFYPPRLVVADPNVLSTLPEGELRSGLAEVVKHGIVADPDLFEFCAQGYEKVKQDWVRVVRRAVGVKVQIIEQDPFETGVRAALNLGHTIGHAVELASNFRLRHGEAVSIGIVAEAELSNKLGLSEKEIVEKIKSALSANGLPTEIPSDLPAGEIIQAMRVDKKKAGKVIKFALPIDVGKVQVGVPVSDLESVL